MARCRDLIMQAITNGTNYTLDVELLESLRRQCARRAPGHSPAHVHVPGMKANLSVSLSSLKTDDATLSVTLESNGISGLPDTVYWDADSLMSARKEPRSAATMGGLQNSSKSPLVWVGRNFRKLHPISVDKKAMRR